MAIGQKLEEARNRKGISIREVTESTKIRSDYISSFEAGDFDIILPEVYLRGFVRLYARFLGLDEDAIVADLNIELGTAASKSQKKNLGAINANEAPDVLDLSKKPSAKEKYPRSNSHSKSRLIPITVMSIFGLLIFGLVIFQVFTNSDGESDKMEISVVKEIDQIEPIENELLNGDETHVLNLAVVSPIDHLIICDEGQDPKKYYEFKDLPEGWEKSLKFKKSFRCYSSSLENFRFAVDDGIEKQVSGSGSGNFSWPTTQPR